MTWRQKEEAVVWGMYFVTDLCGTEIQAALLSKNDVLMAKVAAVVLLRSPVGGERHNNSGSLRGLAPAPAPTKTT
jgi:hypothetical protein